MYYAAGRARVPLWLMTLEAAGYDPLRAMEIEERVSQEWWDRYLLDRDQRIKRANRVE